MSPEIRDLILCRMLEAHGDRVNAAHARNFLEVRRLLLVGRLDEAERTLAELDPTPLPPASRAAHKVVAGIAVRRLQTKAARAAREVGIPALTAEVESTSLVKRLCRLSPEWRAAPIPRAMSATQCRRSGAYRQSTDFAWVGLG